MPPRTRKRIRRRPAPPPRTTAAPRRLFEALLSVVVLGLAYEWTQGSEPEPAWYAGPPPADSSPGESWAFGIRTADDLALRADGWGLPLAAGPSDPVAVCSLAVGELWAGTAADPVTGHVGRDAVCALPMPGRWTSPPTRAESSDVLASVVPTSGPTPRAASASRTSPHSAAAALASRPGPADWHVGPSRQTDLIASVGDDDR